jgi:hypothetical protein
MNYIHNENDDLGKPNKSAVADLERASQFRHRTRPATPWRGVAAPSYDLRGRANNAAQAYEAFDCDNQDEDDADLKR